MPRKAKEKRVPVRIQLIVGACKAGQTVCMSLRHSEIGEEKVYWLEPSGKSAGSKSVEQAVEMGLLIPSGDGLFGLSQTFRAAAHA